MSGPHEEMTGEEARLLAELGQALGPAAPPPGLVARAEALVVFADFDRQLARLIQAESAEPAGTRGAATATEAVRFQVDDGSVAVEVLAARGRLEGQVVAGAVTEVVLERVAGAAVTAAVDDLGRFAFEQPAAGPVRLRLHGVHIGPTPVATDWFLP